MRGEIVMLPTEELSDYSLTNPTQHTVHRKNKLDLTCPVCFDKYKPDDKIYVLSCGHHFCVGCLDNWVKIEYKKEKSSCNCSHCNKEPENVSSINFSDYSCPCCRNKIKDNLLLDSGILQKLKIPLARDIFRLTCSNDPKYAEYKTFSKFQLFQLICIEQICREQLDTKLFELTYVKEKVKKEKKSRKDKLVLKNKFDSVKVNFNKHFQNNKNNKTWYKTKKY
jgi:hypothetical protein